LDALSNIELRVLALDEVNFTGSAPLQNRSASSTRFDISPMSFESPSSVSAPRK
jgi:hypothetical protein